MKTKKNGPGSHSESAKRVDLKDYSAKMVDPISLNVYSAKDIGPISLHSQRESAREKVTLSLIFLALITISWPVLIWVFRGEVTPEMLLYTKDMVAVEAGLLGVALGFYFKG